MAQLSPNLLFDNRYLLIKRIGRGGFGEVWKANDTKFDNRVIALKVISPEHGLSEPARNAFKNDFLKTRPLNHPNLLRADHYGEFEEQPYIVMPLCEKGSLEDKVVAGEKIASERALVKLLHQTASALAYMHDEKNTCHNDIKPGNILIDEDNNYVLTDFGISTPTRTTVFKDSKERSKISQNEQISGMAIAYAATELFGEYPINTPKTDIFSLGVTLFEAASGNLPWLGQGGISLKNGADIPNLTAIGEFSNKLNALYRQCLNPDPTQRPTARELAVKSKFYLDNGYWQGYDFPPTPPVIEGGDIPAPKPKSKWLITVLAILGGLLLGWLGYKFLTKDTQTTASSGCDSPILDKIKSNPKGFIIAKESDAPPMFWCNDYNNFSNCQGFEYEFGQMLAGKLGIDNVSYIIGEYDILPDYIKNDKAHVVIAGYVPDNEITNIDWSDSYLDFGLCLIVKKGSAIKTVNDLNVSGKKVVVYKGDPTPIEWAKSNIPSCQIMEKADPEENGGVWMKGVVDGTIDAAVYDYPFAIAELKEYYPDLQIVKVNLNKSHYSIGIPSGNLCFKEKINQAISEIKNSSRYGDLVKKYLKTDALAVTTNISPDDRIHVVQAGETLSIICDNELGDLNRWDEVWHLPENFERFPNPHLISVGDKIVLPKK